MEPTIAAGRHITYSAWGDKEARAGQEDPRTGVVEVVLPNGFLVVKADQDKTYKSIHESQVLYVALDESSTGNNIEAIRYFTPSNNIGRTVAAGEMKNSNLLAELHAFGRNLSKVITSMFEKVKAFLTSAFRVLRRYVYKSYVGTLILEYTRLTSVLDLTKKTVARRKIIRRMREIEKFIRRLQEGFT